MGEQVELFGHLQTQADERAVAAAPRGESAVPAPPATPIDAQASTSGFDATGIAALVDRWALKTVHAPQRRVRIPLHLLRQEALELAELVQRYSQPTQEHGETLPGLIADGRSQVITHETSQELRELQLALGAVQSQISSSTTVLDEEPSEEARILLSEVKAALRFLLEGGKHPDGVAQLKRVRRAHRGDNSMGGRIQELREYAELCKQHKVELKKLGKAEAKLASRALAAAEALSARASAGRMRHDQRLEITQLRDQLAQDLLARMREVRRVIRYVFRAHPHIARQAQSTYERTNRRRQKAKAALGPR